MQWNTKLFQFPRKYYSVVFWSKRRERSLSTYQFEVHFSQPSAMPEQWSFEQQPYDEKFMTLKNANWINEAWADFIQKIRALMNTRARGGASVEISNH